MTLGEKLVMLRKQNNMTQEEIGSILNVSRQAIQKWESNSSLPDIYKLKQIADYYNVTVDYLLNEDLINNSNKLNNIKSDSENLIEYIKLIVDLIAGVDKLNLTFDITNEGKLCELLIFENKIVIDVNNIINCGLSIKLIFELIRILFIYNEISYNHISNEDFILLSCNIFASKFCEFVYDVHVKYDDSPMNIFVEKNVLKMFNEKYNKVIEYLRDKSNEYTINFDLDFSYDNQYIASILNQKENNCKEDIVTTKNDNDLNVNNIPINKNNYNGDSVLTNKSIDYKIISYVFFAIFIIVYFIYDFIFVDKNFFRAFASTIGFGLFAFLFIALVAKRKIVKIGSIVVCILMNFGIAGIIGSFYLTNGYSFMLGFVGGPLICIPFDIGIALLYKSVKQG